MQVKGGSHCPVGVMRASAHTGYCLTLESAGLAAKLPFSQAPLWEKMSGTARQFPSNRKLDEGGKDDWMKLTRHNGRAEKMAFTIPSIMTADLTLKTASI